MNKAELIADVAAKTQTTKKEAGVAVNSVLEAIQTSLEHGDTVSLVGFGTFTVRTRAERVARNPRTKENVHIPATKAPVFKPGKALKDAVLEK